MPFLWQKWGRKGSLKRGASKPSAKQMVCNGFACFGFAETHFVRFQTALTRYFRVKSAFSSSFKRTTQ